MSIQVRDVALKECLQRLLAGLNYAILYQGQDAWQPSGQPPAMKVELKIFGKKEPRRATRSPSVPAYKPPVAQVPVLPEETGATDPDDEEVLEDLEVEQSRAGNGNSEEALEDEGATGAEASEDDPDEESPLEEQDASAP